MSDGNRSFVEQADEKTLFTAVEVLALRLGALPEQVDPQDAAVHRMRDDYERGLSNTEDATCIRSVDSVRFHALGPAMYARWRDPYVGPDTRPRFEDDPPEMSQPQEVQLVGPMAVLERQRFRREEVARWISVNKLPSKYEFGGRAPALNLMEAKKGSRVAPETKPPTNELGSSDEPAAAPATVTHRLTGRMDILGAAIERAVKEAGTREWAPVFARLRELALGGVPPFTGEVTPDGLLYTDAKNKVKPYTAEALRKRLNPAARGKKSAA